MVPSRVATNHSIVERPDLEGPKLMMTAFSTATVRLCFGIRIQAPVSPCSLCVARLRA